MPLLKSDYYTSKDYWNQPEGERAELIDGKFYDMAPPSRIHQKISGQIYKIIANYIDSHHGLCEVYPHHLPLILTQMIKTGWNPMFP